MTTVAKADKSRLTIRGLVDGEQYLVREQPGGWFITPEKTHRVKKTGMRAETFAKLYRSRSPLDADTAKEISANLAAIDKAKWESCWILACWWKVNAEILISANGWLPRATKFLFVMPRLPNISPGNR